MSTASVPRTRPRLPRPEAELEDELRHIRDLVFVRQLLCEQGATETELRDCDATIEQAHALLARAAKRASIQYASAA